MLQLLPAGIAYLLPMFLAGLNHRRGHLSLTSAVSMFVVEPELESAPVDLAFVYHTQTHHTLTIGLLFQQRPTTHIFSVR